MTARSFIIDLDRDPGVQLRIDSFNVPAAARHEFEVAMERNLGFIKTLPGFKWHMAFEKASGPSTFNVITIAVWENRQAMEKAITDVRAYYEQIGFDPREMTARLSITANVGNQYVPIKAGMAAVE